MGEFDAALAELLDASGLRLVSPFDQDSNHGWYVAGDLYYKKDDFEAAARAFDKSIANSPDDHQALLALANCYAELGAPIASERYLRLAMKCSADTGIIYNLGNALFDQGRYEEAVAAYSGIAPDAGELFDLAQKNMRIAKARMIDEDG